MGLIVVVSATLAACSSSDTAAPTSTTTTSALAFTGPGTTKDTPFCKVISDTLAALRVAGTAADPAQSARLLEEVKGKFKDSVALAPADVKPSLTTVSDSVQNMATVKEIYTQSEAATTASNQVRAWIAANCGISS